jgi:hypothetical protein
VQFSEAANQRSVMAISNPRSEHTASYRRLLAELLKVVGGPGLDRVETLEGAGSDRAEVEVGV